MKQNKIGFILYGLSLTPMTHGMGLGSFVALPVEKQGAVMRWVFEHQKKTNINQLKTNIDVGLSAKQTLLIGLPYQISPSKKNQQGDLSAIYRHIIWQKDRLTGTDRLGLLAGVVIPTAQQRKIATQAGFVLTHFEQRHEIDIDLLYQAGLDGRKDKGRADLSWQYRLFPQKRLDWGISSELNSIVEFNGRWVERNKMTQKITLGWQWINKKWVLEGGISKAINNQSNLQYILSTRFHF